MLPTKSHTEKPEERNAYEVYEASGWASAWKIRVQLTKRALDEPSADGISPLSTHDA